jgi:hypothetical protein
VRTILAVGITGAVVIAGIASTRDPRGRVEVLPVHGGTSYELNVLVEGRSLGSSEVEGRYAVPFRGRTSLTPEGLRALVRARELAAGDAAAFVRLHVHLGAGEEEVWLWPES